MRLIRTCLLLLAIAFTARLASAQTTAATMPSMPGMPGMPAATTIPATAKDVHVALSTDVEDGKKQLIATVTRNNKPVDGATVSFGAKRTFGRLVLGSDVTLDDGTAAIRFPSDLPGDAQGNLELDAMVQGPLSQWGAAAQATLPGGTPKQPPVEYFPRALWSPSAPIGLIIAILVLVGGAWGSYAFVAYQLVVIRRGVSR